MEYGRTKATSLCVGHHPSASLELLTLLLLKFVGVPLSNLSPLNDRSWPFSLSELPSPAYLVGGIVRDALLARRADYLDLDFVVTSGAIEIAQNIARTHQAGFVVLDAERQIARVVFPHATVDFAQQEGETLEADLQRRDFTVNAMAYNPHTHVLIDPLGGYVDLQQGCIRMVAAENLAADPLRLLRAYRQAAQLNFHLEAATQTCITQFSSLIGQVAAERVQSELSYLFHHPQGAPWILEAWQAGLLDPWFPSVTPLHLHRLQAIEPVVQILSSRWPHLGAALQPPLKSKEMANAKSEGFGRSLWGFLRLCTLLSANPVGTEGTLRKLKASRWEMRSAALLCRLVPVLHAPRITLREQYFLYKDVQNLWPVLTVLALLCRANPGYLESLVQSTLNPPNPEPDPPNLDSLLSEMDPGAIAPSLDQFFDPDNLTAHPRPLLSGRELMQALSLPSGPQVGTLLTEIQLAQAAGQVHSRDEALDLAQNLTKGMINP